MLARRSTVPGNLPVPFRFLLSFLLLAALAAPFALLRGGGAEAGPDPARRVRTLPAVRPGSAPAVDGRLDDAAWGAAEVACGSGRPAPDLQGPCTSASGAPTGRGSRRATSVRW